jgi:hypothetical protein
MYPHGDFDKDAVERCLKYALEGRRRVKEQLKKIGGMEVYDVHFSYIDNEFLEEKFVSVLEQGTSWAYTGRSSRLPAEPEGSLYPVLVQVPKLEKLSRWVLIISRPTPQG